MRIKSMAAAFVAVAATLAISASAQAAPAEVIYNNLPSSEALPSLGYAGYSTSEFGSQVTLTGTDRSEPTFTVDMDSWACESGQWNEGNCVTTPGTKYSVPITLNVYEVANDGEPGALLDTVTNTFELPYRPSSDKAACETSAEGEYAFMDAEGECEEGLLAPIHFDTSHLTLPSSVIVSIAFNTSVHGYSPTGTATEPANSLNLALAGPASVGSTPREAEGVYWASSHYGNGENVFAFSKEPGEWTGYQPAIAVEAFAPQVGPEGKAGPVGTTGAEGKEGKAGSTGATGTVGKEGPAGHEGKTAKGEVLAAKEASGFGIAALVTKGLPKSGLKVVKGSVSLTVRCTGPKGKRCKGTVSLLAHGGGSSKASFSLAVGHSAKVKVKLSKALLATLQKLGSKGLSSHVSVSTLRTGAKAVVKRSTVKLVD